MRIRLYNPKFRFYKSRGIFPYHSNLLFGFENEVNINEHIITQKGEKKIDDFLRKYPFIYFKEEVGFENGAELNSHPMNWNFYLKNKDFVKDLCDLQNKYFFKSTMQCGFHIHFSRKYFTKKHLRKLCKFFYSKKHYDFLFKISGRRISSFAEWCSPLLPIDYYETNYETNSENYKQYTYKDVANFTRYQFNSNLGGKGYILNLFPKHTIELRMFAGTLNPKRMMAYMEFCLAVILFTEQFEEKDITVKNFKKYVKDNITKHSLTNCYNLIYDRH